LTDNKNKRKLTVY